MGVMAVAVWLPGRTSRSRLHSRCFLVGESRAKACHARACFGGQQQNRLSEGARGSAYLAPSWCGLSRRLRSICGDACYTRQYVAFIRLVPRPLAMRSTSQLPWLPRVAQPNERAWSLPLTGPSGGCGIAGLADSSGHVTRVCKHTCSLIRRRVDATVPGWWGFALIAFVCGSQRQRRADATPADWRRAGVKKVDVR